MLIKKEGQNLDSRTDVKTGKLGQNIWGKLAETTNWWFNSEGVRTMIKCI